jgi:Ca2+-binding EF-hand superfamily protein
MSSSIGGSAALNLALLNQLLQRVGAADQDTTDGTETVDASSAGQAVASQATGDSSSFTAQTDALFNALDGDGDGKLSKSELRTGFQTLSQDMRSFFLSQQDVAGGSATGDGATGEAGAAATSAATGAAFATFGSLDSNGDGSISKSEFEAGLSASTSATSGAGDSLQNMNAGQLLERLLQAAGGTAAGSLFNTLDSNGDGSISQSEFVTGLSATPASTATTSATSDSDASSTGSADGNTIANLLDKIDSNGNDSISSEDWTKLLQDLQSRDVGEVANAPAMMRLQQSTNLNAALSDLLQATDIRSSGAASSAGV